MDLQKSKLVVGTGYDAEAAIVLRDDWDLVDSILLQLTCLHYSCVIGGQSVLFVVKLNEHGAIAKPDDIRRQPSL